MADHPNVRSDQDRSSVTSPRRASNLSQDKSAGCTSQKLSRTNVGPKFAAHCPAMAVWKFRRRLAFVRGNLDFGARQSHDPPSYPHPSRKRPTRAPLCLSRPAQPTLTPLHLQRATLGPLVGSLRRAQRSPLSIGANGIYQYTQYIRDGSSTINTKPLPDGDFEDLIYMSGSRRAFKASSLRQLQMQSSWGSEAVD